MIVPCAAVSNKYSKLLYSIKDQYVIYALSRYMLLVGGAPFY